MNYKGVITGLVSVVVSCFLLAVSGLQAAVAIRDGIQSLALPYASQSSQLGYTSVEQAPQAPTSMRERQPTGQLESSKALVLHQDEDPNALSGLVNDDRHAPQLMVEQSQPVIQVAPQRPVVLPQIDEPRRPENQYGLRGNKPKLLELSHRAMKTLFFRGWLRCEC
jgi:hypothetical protein